MGSCSRGFVPWGLLGLSIVGIAGCGGGGGGSDSGGGSPEPATEVKAGAFNTTISYPNSDNTVSGVAFVSPTGRFASVVVKTLVYSDGRLNFDGSGGVSGPVRDVAYSNSENRWVVNTGTLEGTVENSANMVLTGKGNDFESQIAFEREPVLSDHRIRLSDIAGTYSMYGSIIGDVSFTVGADGELTGSDGDCTFFGELTIPNTEINVYEVNFNATGCDTVKNGVEGEQRNGDYSGVGSFIPDETGSLSFGSSNGNVALIFVGGR